MLMSIRDEVSRNGYVFLPAFARDHSGQEAAALLGAPVTFQTGLVVHRLVPTVQEHSTPNTYSGIYGHGQFPLHTDRANWQHPTRYFMLRCIVGFETVPTFLVDGKDIAEEVGANILTRALVQSRRPMAGSLPLMRLFTPQEGEHGMLRWDDLFIRAASNAGSLGMNMFRECIASVEPKKITLAHPADTLIVDNWRMLHGRSTVSANSQGRIIERAYLEALI
jgi:L-asparagine oxygenase